MTADADASPPNVTIGTLCMWPTCRASWTARSLASHLSPAGQPYSWAGLLVAIVDVVMCGGTSSWMISDDGGSCWSTISSPAVVGSVVVPSMCRHSVETFCERGRRVPRYVCEPRSVTSRCGDVDRDAGAELLGLFMIGNELEFKLVHNIHTRKKNTYRKISFTDSDSILVVSSRDTRF